MRRRARCQTRMKPLRGWRAWRVGSSKGSSRRRRRPAAAKVWMEKAHLEQLTAFLVYKLSVIARSHPTRGAASCGGLPGHAPGLLIGGLGGGPLRPGVAASRDDLTGATTWRPMAAGMRTLATADVQLAMTENFNTALEAVLGPTPGHRQGESG